MEGFVNEKFGDLEVSKVLRMINKDDLLVSYDIPSPYPSAEADWNSIWRAIETTYPFEKIMNDAVCEIYKSGRLN